MPDINTLLYFIAPILLLAILVPCIVLLIVYRRYVRLAKALPDPGTIRQAQPEALDEKRDAVASILLSDWAKVPEHETAATRHALWTAMLLEAAADGSIDHREMRFVADLFGRWAARTWTSGRSSRPPSWSRTTRNRRSPRSPRLQR